MLTSKTLGLATFIAVGGAMLLTFAGCAADEGADPTVADEAEVVRSAAEIVLRYDATRKAELIHDRVYKADEFTGNDVVVKTVRTRIDIASLLPDSDTTAPNSLCYRGQVPGVKKILQALVGNTDGNGDHFLQGSPRIDEGAAAKLKLSFTVVGEGGPVSHALDVPRCP